MPLLNHRLHQAVKKGAKVYAVNPAHFDFNYPLAGESLVAPQALVDALLALAKARSAAGATATGSAGRRDHRRGGRSCRRDNAGDSLR